MANGYGGSSGSSSATSVASLPRTYVFSGTTEKAPLGYHYMEDGTLMSDIEHIEKFNGKKLQIKELVIDTSPMSRHVPGSRRFTITSDPGAVFSLWVKDVTQSKFYNFTTGTFESTENYLSRQRINAGTYTGIIRFPETKATSIQYEFLLLADYTSGTIHAPYTEFRNPDGSIDVNKSLGSDSLILTKKIQSTQDQTLTISPISVSGNAGFSSATFTTTAKRDTFGGSINKLPFTLTVTTANGKAVKIDRQPNISDFAGRLTAGIQAKLPVEDATTFFASETSFTGNDNSTIATARSTDTVDGAVSGGTTITMDTNVADKMKVNDRVTGTGISSSSIVRVVELNPSGSNAKQFSVTEAVTIGDGVTLSFTPAHSFKYSSTSNLAYVPVGAQIVGTDATSIALLTNTSGVISSSVTEVEYQDSLVDVVDDTTKIPSANSNGGNLTFSNKLPIDVIGDDFYFYGYGPGSINTITGYSIEITDLKAELTPVSTTVTSSSGTSLGVASGRGIMDDVSIASSPNMNVAVSNPTVTNIGSYNESSAQTATLTLSSSQTLETGETVTFEGAGQTVTITGNMKINNVGRGDTIYLNIDNFLTATTETA